MKHLFKQPFFYTSIFSLIALGLIIGNFVFGWIPPTATPPSSNLPAPINVSSTAQSKQGYLAIGTSTAPSYPLDVVGTIQSTGFKLSTEAGANKVLTSDASGVASWQTATSTGVPSGAVMYFNLSTCPTGWTELTSARGRYLVGLPTSGTLAGTQGTQLSNLENRAVGQHTHSISDPGHSHGYPPYKGNPCGGYAGWYNGGCQLPPESSVGLAVTGITLQQAGSVANTNAPYLQLLVCQKD